MNSSEAPFMNETLAGAEEVARHRNRKPHRARRSVLFQGPPSLMRGIRRSSGSRCSIPSKNSPEAPSLDETLLYPEERRVWEASDPLDDLGSLETLASDGWRIGWEMAQEMEMGFSQDETWIGMEFQWNKHVSARHQVRLSPRPLRVRSRPVTRESLLSHLPCSFFGTKKSAVLSLRSHSRRPPRSLPPLPAPLPPIYTAVTASDDWKPTWIGVVRIAQTRCYKPKADPPSLFLLLLRSSEDHYDLRRFGVDTDRK
ncbi:hypothetical protein GW17_00059373, partial [Ensete ventricosum]